MSLFRLRLWLVSATMLALVGSTMASATPACELDLRVLQPLCTELPRCATLRAEMASLTVVPTGGWAHSQLEVQKDQACTQAKACREQARNLCTRAKCEQAKDAGMRRACRTLLDSEWRSRQQIVDLANGAAGDETCDSSGPAACPADTTSLPLFQQIYQARCESPRSCMNWISARANRWQSELQLKRDEVSAIEADTRSARANAELQAQATQAVAAGTQAVANGTERVADAGVLNAASGMANAAATHALGQHVSGAIKRELSVAIGDGLSSISGSLEQVAASIDNLAQPPGASTIPAQIDPKSDYEDLYPAAGSISYAVLLVPDPRVPRHRRAYDLAIAATMRGMLQAGFVLDRYKMPWQAYLDDPANHAAKPERERYADDGQYGVMVFREDLWRDQVPPGQHGMRMRALLVVAETGTFGVQREAFVRAVARIYHKTIQSKLGHPTPIHSLLAPAGAVTEEIERVSAVTVLGPSFSGSISSIAQATKDIDRHIVDHSPINSDSANALRQLSQAIQAHIDSSSFRHCNREQLRVLDREIGKLQMPAGMQSVLDTLEYLENVPLLSKATCFCRERDDLIGKVRKQKSDYARLGQVQLRLEAAATTVLSNREISGLNSRISYRSWAVNDFDKLDALAQRFGLEAGTDVVLFTEASTFGRGLCASKPLPILCQGAREIRFPANIADIRHGARARALEAEKAARAALRLPDLDSVLDLASGAEDGSEFPESQRSTITASSAAMELEQAIRMAKESRPKLIVLAATDIRDRLFLVDRLRSEVPSALLVDLEADVLLAHPSMLHASRGMLVIGSAPLRLRSAPDPSRTAGQQGTQPSETFSTDDQTLLFCIVSHLRIPGVPGVSREPELCAKLVPEDQPAASRGERGTASTNFTLVSRRGLMSAKVPDCCSLIAAPVALCLGLWLIVLGVAWLGSNGPAVPSLQATASPTWLPVAAAGSALALAAVLASTEFPGLLFAIDWVSGMDLRAAYAIGLAGLLWGVLLLIRAREDQLYAQLRGDEPSSGAGSVQLILRPLRLPEGAEAALGIAALCMLLWLVWRSQRDGIHYSPGAMHEYLLWSIQVVLCAMAWWAVVQASMWMQELRRVRQRLQALVWRALGSNLPDWDVLPQALSEIKLGGAPGIRPTWVPPHFAASPFLAGLSSWRWPLVALIGDDPGTVAGREALSRRLAALKLGFEDTLCNRVLLAYVSAFLLQRLRSALYSAMAASITLVLLGYAWPVTGRDGFLLYALALMTLAAMVFAYGLVITERSDVYSRLLSNTPGKTQISWQFVSAFLAPFVLVALAIAVMEVPGVMQWGGGLVGPLVGHFGW